MLGSQFGQTVAMSPTIWPAKIAKIEQYIGNCSEFSRESAVKYRKGRKGIPYKVRPKPGRTQKAK